MPLYEITTKVEKSDYKKFLITAAFKSSPIIIVILIGIPFLAVTAVNIRHQLSLPNFIISWAAMFAISVAALIYSVLSKNKEIIKKIDSMPAQKYCLYNDYMEIGNSKIEYKSLHRVVSEKDFLVIYYTPKQASFIRKKDMPSEIVSDVEKLLKCQK